MKPKPIDRKGWDPGPWDDEPDQLEWTTKVGYPGFINRGDLSGALNGYVAVEKTHPLYGKNYHNVDLYVHGGVTFAERSAPGRQADPNEELWWFGFDAGHAWDVKPAYNALLRKSRLGRLPWDGLNEIYRDLTFIKGEVEDLARQLKAKELS